MLQNGLVHNYVIDSRVLVYKPIQTVVNWILFDNDVVLNHNETNYRLNMSANSFVLILNQDISIIFLYHR